ncbi:MAG: outer membrane lipoprotein-sorting protein [Desulfobacteraceae bacterium]|nr:outer membrane lipoprotein-sorting protein [Desulfobacteraceae bacterium]
MKRFFIIAAIFLGSATVPLDGGHSQDPRALVENAVNYLRGETSVSEVKMTIHRPDWERTMEIRAWTKGREYSIFWIASPPRDRGNGTLKKNDEMWIYNPKVNRVIKLPPSMMSQSWQGSDFSNNDLAKSDNIVDQYTHEIVGTETHNTKTVYVIRSLPKPGAPVIWGMQELKIREDSILIQQTFFDEDKKPVKTLFIEKIAMMDGKLYPVEWKMAKHGEKEKYTVLDYKSLEFGVEIPARMFTVTNLKNPRL